MSCRDPKRFLFKYLKQKGPEELEPTQTWPICLFLNKNDIFFAIHDQGSPHVHVQLDPLERSFFSKDRHQWNHSKTLTPKNMNMQHNEHIHDTRSNSGYYANLSNHDARK